MRVRSSWILALVGIGCAADPDPVVEPARVAAPEPDVVLDLPPIDLAAGEETTVCVRHRLDNDSPIHVRAIITEQAEVGHHLTVFRSGEEEESVETQSCFQGSYEPLFAGARAPLFASQIAHEALVFPEGTGLRLDRRQMIEIEVHVLNTEPFAIEAFGSVGLAFAPAGEPTVDVHMHQYLATDISIARETASTVGPAFVPIEDGREVVAVSAHTHDLGLDVQAWKASGPDTDSIVTSIYPHDDFDWSSPAFARIDPPVGFAPGEGVLFQCDYYNNRDEEVRFGLQTHDEMCLVWVFTKASPFPETCLIDRYDRECFAEGTRPSEDF